MRPYLRALLLLVLASGALPLGESAALAQGYYYGPPPPPPPPPGYYRPSYAEPYYYPPDSHDGFFVRLTAGLGYLAASETIQGTTYKYSGVGFSFGGAVGGAVAHNLIVFGELLGTTAFDADLTIGGAAAGLSGLDVTLLGIGPGIAYYLEPSNVYLSATLAFSKVSFSDTYSQYTVSDTNWGVGATFMVGKEWWVRRRLGFGLAGQVYLATMTDPYYDPNQGVNSDTRLGAVAFSLLASLSFN